MSVNENWTVDKLLRKVYSVHKQSLNDVSSDLANCKEKLQRLEEINKALQIQNDNLTLENKRLSVQEGSKQPSNGSCCEVIRQSLQMVITSYKELLENKDQRIHHLENELKKYKRKFQTLDSIDWSVDDTSQKSIPRTKAQLDNIPDSTSKLTPKGKSAVPKTQIPNLHVLSKNTIVENSVEKGADKSLEESQKLRLQRRGKRSRYSEEISPERKRSKHTGDSNTDIIPVKNSGYEKVMVHDTCYTHPDNNVNKDYGNSKDKTVDDGKNLEETVFVVPETLAMDADCSDDEEDGGIITDKFIPALSTINEMSHTSNSEIKDNKNTKDKETICKNGGDLALNTGSYSLVDVLQDSNEDSTDADHSLYEAISDIGASIVEDSDHETENSLSSVRSRSVCTTNTEVSYRSQSLGGRCRSMAEINELFETPEGKTNTEVKKPHEVAQNKKRLFKRFSKSDGIQEEQVLRRSPRKLKGSMVKPRRNTTGSTFSQDNTERPQETLKCNISENSADNDITIAPDFDAKNCSTENQSMDLYNVVPVKNGEPIKGKQFQMRLKKNKSDTKGKTKEKIEHTGDDEIKGQSHVYNTGVNISTGSKVLEVIPISSPSVSSLSDPDSPLLLKTIKSGKTEIKGKSGTGEACTGQSNSKSNMHKPSPLKVNSAGSCTSQTNSKKHKKMEHQNMTKDTKCEKHCGNSPTSKNLRQSTLTQRFFSPTKRNNKVFESSENKENGRLLVPLQQAVKIDEEVIITGDSPPFKKPPNPSDKEYLSTRWKGKKQHDLDETVSSQHDHDVLQDISSKHLNGSLDPAAELSILCREPETLENQPMKSLPSFDTDFCAEDLVTSCESLPKTSTLMADESDDISPSYKFMPTKKSQGNLGKENLHASLDDSFDRPPKKAVDNVAHIAVVRKKDERQKLQGYGCKQCEEYYKSTGRNDEEVKKHMNQCSRHRAQYLPPDTPPHFWSVGFIDTQECVDRGYLKIDNKQEKTEGDGPTYRRRRRLNKYFKSKTEGSPDDSEEELVYE